MHRRRLLLGLIAAASPALPLGASVARAEEGNKEAGKKKGGGLTYRQFPNLSAVVVRADGRRGVLTVDSGVDVPDAALRNRVGLYEPRLLDAYASSMQVFGANLRPGAAPDLDRLSARLQADTDRVLGQTGARFLLGTVLLN